MVSMRNLSIRSSIGPSWQNLHWKLGQLAPSFGCFLVYKRLRLKKYFCLGIKLFFVFQDRKLKLSESVWKRISINLSEFEVIQLIQAIVIFNLSIGCLIELKLCELSLNSFSNRCWKFLLSIVENKKSFIPSQKYFLSCCQYQKKSFVYWPNFQWRFCFLAFHDRQSCFDSAFFQSSIASIHKKPNYLSAIPTIDRA